MINEGGEGGLMFALNLLLCIQKHKTYAGSRSFHEIRKTTQEQLDLPDIPNLPKPA